MWHRTRRDFLKLVGVAAGSAGLGLRASETPAGERPRRGPDVEILQPEDRVPLSFFIDDSTCLVNMGHFCMPQFAAAWPDREIYKKPWKTWPREIPDAFLREFGTWCAEHGVKGKFSIVPYPCCVGWLDRELPGWSREDLRDSLKLVRELMVPRWDIHPEMISHTRVIDLKTGRPFAEVSSATMENSYPQGHKSVDELAAYLAYALRILKNCDIPCEGITTPGGFGNGVESELSQAVEESVRDVYGAEIPHYFKYVSGGKESTEPKLEHVKGLEGSDLRLTVNLPASTDDWFGGWDGDRPSEGHRYSSDDATSGRMVELIERGTPAIMLCHWPGLYCNGTKRGFEDLRRVILALEGRFADRTIWMKPNELARYWAAKELTGIEKEGAEITFRAPFASPRFTVRVGARGDAVPALKAGGVPVELKEVTRAKDLESGTWIRGKGAKITICFDLPKGKSLLRL